MRASDDDRQRVVDELRRHTADGRLTLEEFEERVGEAYRAVTVDDLQHVLRELPAPVAAPSTTDAVADRARTRPGLPTPALVALLVVVGSILLSHFAWWLIPVGFWVFGGGRHACHGSARRDPARI